MTKDEKHLLSLAAPEVVLQSHPTSAHPDDNAHHYAAACLVEMGWLEFVRDDDKFQRSVFRITRAGVDALRKVNCCHPAYTADKVTGECNCDDCGKLLIDCLGRVIDG